MSGVIFNWTKAYNKCSDVMSMDDKLGISV